MMTENTTRAGYVAIVGRPNVGKSTLLNRLLGQKVSITSRRPQTTRHRILGIKTEADYQAIFVDTPGVHTENKRMLNRFMNKAALDTLVDVDVIMFVIAGDRWTDLDEYVFERVKAAAKPIILVINKVDLIEDKAALLPYIEQLNTRHAFVAIVPVSAAKGNQTDVLEQCVREQLPLSEWIYPEDQLTDRSERFLAAELIREKLMRSLGAEVPYGLTVEIESFKEEGELYHIHAIVWVDRPGHKSIVIGEKGAGLKNVGTQARRDMERLFDKKVFLKTWVKVKEGWADDERALRSIAHFDP
jgi:GTPase